jgi:hypothetical protein
MCIGSSLVWNHTEQRHVNALLQHSGIFLPDQHTSLNDIRSFGDRKFYKMILCHAGLLPKIIAAEHFMNLRYMKTAS